MRLRSSTVLAALLVTGGAIYVSWGGFGVQISADYGRLFAPAMNGLLAGHLGSFFANLPDEGAGGSILLRAPAALIGKLLVGSQLGIFRFGSLECMLASGALGLVLAGRMRRAGRPLVGRVAVAGLCVLVPGFLDAVKFGHPEEALGATLCVTSVLLAADDRGTLAGIALGLAVINKPWGLLAAAPALLVVRDGGRLRLVVSASTVVLVWLWAALLGAPGHFWAQLNGIAIAVAHPPDLWWPLAHPAVTPGGMHVYYVPPLVASHGRELALAAIVPLSIPLARSRARTAESCLALLALLMLLRCLLDPSDHVYYNVPFVIALVAWEARASDAPLASLATTALLWFVFHTVSGIASVDVQFGCYVAVALPLVALLARPALGLSARSRAAIVPAL